jgi:hypothetical protein
MILTKGQIYPHKNGCHCFRCSKISWNKNKTGLQRAWNKGLKGFMANEKNASWKGEEVGYRGLHNWIQRALGKINECVYCGIESWEKRIEWASISHQAKRDLDDFIPLCITCHRNYDKQGRRNLI